MSVFNVVHSGQDWQLTLLIRKAFILLQCPSTIGEELLYNPFLRTKHECLLRAAGIVCADEEEQLNAPSDELRAKALAEIREQKDSFKYIQWERSHWTSCATVIFNKKKTAMIGFFFFKESSGRFAAQVWADIWFITGYVVMWQVCYIASGLKYSLWFCMQQFHYLFNWQHFIYIEHMFPRCLILVLTKHKKGSLFCSVTLL